MIAEPYICTKGPLAGSIASFEANIPPTATIEGIDTKDGNEWQPYADFEREKLKELCHGEGVRLGDGGYEIHLESRVYESRMLTKEPRGCIWGASESSRLLKRAEFLKAVCEKEGVEWLPADKPDCYCKGTLSGERTTHATEGCALHSEFSWNHLRDHAESLSLPSEKVCVPDGPFERNYYTKQEVDDMKADLQQQIANLAAELKLHKDDDHIWKGQMEIRTTSLLDEEFYTKAEINERIRSLINFQEWLEKHYTPKGLKEYLSELRQRYLPR